MLKFHNANAMQIPRITQSKSYKLSQTRLTNQYVPGKNYTDSTLFARNRVIGQSNLRMNLSRNSIIMQGGILLHMSSSYQ